MPDDVSSAQPLAAGCVMRSETIIARSPQQRSDAFRAASRTVRSAYFRLISNHVISPCGVVSAASNGAQRKPDQKLWPGFAD
jgi:hypothetical protein